MANIFQLQRPDDIRHDKVMVSEILALCRDGSRFYRAVADCADNQALRNALLDMARVRDGIVRELVAATADCVLDATIRNTTLAELIRWYSSSQPAATTLDDQVFVRELVQHEHTALLELRRRARTLHTRRFSNLVASHIASMQMVFDRIRSLDRDLGTGTRHNPNHKRSG